MIIMELWDAYNKKGDKLGFDLKLGEVIPSKHIWTQMSVWIHKRYA